MVLKILIFSLLLNSNFLESESVWGKERNSEVSLPSSRLQMGCGLVSSTLPGSHSTLGNWVMIPASRSLHSVGNRGLSWCLTEQVALGHEDAENLG